MFGGKKVAAAHPLTPIWAGISALMAELEGQSRRLEAEVGDMAEAFQMKLGGLEVLASQLAKERAAVVEDFNKRRSAGTLAPADEDTFWLKVADMDALAEKTSGQVDDARLRIYFPAAKGYLWRIAAPGIFAAVSDFWVERFAVRALSLEALPGSGMAWEAGSAPPTVTLRASGISLSLHVDELGLRGDQVPSTLRRVRSLDLDVEAELLVPLAFEAPVPKKAAAGAGTAASQRGPSGGGAGAWGSASAGGGLPHPSSPGAPPIDRLMGFEWRVLDAFRFEVTRLEVHSKGTGALGVPAALLKYLINAFVPAHVKAALQVGREAAGRRRRCDLLLEGCPLLPRTPSHPPLSPPLGRRPCPPSSASSSPCTRTTASRCAARSSSSRCLSTR